MFEWIRYQFIMRQLRREIAQTVTGKRKTRRFEKMKSSVVTACNAYGSIV